MPIVLLTQASFPAHTRTNARTSLLRASRNVTTDMAHA
jgi:hypothetical protein